MPTHTVPLGDRNARRPKLTDDEACEMFRKGFRFSVFRPGREECRLSLPYETAHDLLHGTLTFIQTDA